MSRQPYVRPMSSEWIFRHPRYVRYMVREFSCLFIGGWTALMVYGLKQLSDGPAAWAAFLSLLKSPAGVVFQLLTLAFATYHSITWFNLTPKALPLQFGEDFVPDWVIAAAHFAAWGLVSVVILALSL
ncbi:MAG TPA: fumarate reductase subunit C [Burkholderiales bacterium]|jgi:fumarate reductase subunit C|nr:fumarate reductase subunit C [Burkholderiales bacterium]